MTLKNVFVFPALRLSGKEAGRHRHRVALSVGEAGTPRGSQRGAQVSTGRARAGEAGPPHCPCGVTVLPLHQHPGTAGKGCFLSRERDTSAGGLGPPEDFSPWCDSLPAVGAHVYRINRMEPWCLNFHFCLLHCRLVRWVALESSEVTSCRDRV